MKSIIISKFSFLIPIIFSSFASAHGHSNINMPILQSLSPENQKLIDHAPASVYLHPQAFSLDVEDMATFTMRVCTEWSSPTQAYIPKHLKNRPDQYSNKYYTPVPYTTNSRVHGRLYQNYSQPGFCRKFKEVKVPTSETILKSIQLLTSQGDTVNYDSLHRVDLDLDRRIKSMMTSTALQKMREEMEVEIKKEILESSFVQELSQQLYEEIKAEIRKESSKDIWGHP